MLIQEIVIQIRTNNFATSFFPPKLLRILSSSNGLFSCCAPPVGVNKNLTTPKKLSFVEKNGRRKMHVDGIMCFLPQENCTSQNETAFFKNGQGTPILQCVFYHLRHGRRKIQEGQFRILFEVKMGSMTCIALCFRAVRCNVLRLLFKKTGQNANL